MPKKKTVAPVEREPTEAEKQAAAKLISDAKLAQLDLIIARSGPLGLDDYIVRESHTAPGRYGIYLRKYNVCVAVFAANSYRLRELLKNLFDDAFDAAAKQAAGWEHGREGRSLAARDPIQNPPKPKRKPKRKGKKK